MRAAVKRSLIAGVAIGTVGLGAVAVVPAFAGHQEIKVVTASSQTGIPGQYIVTVKSATSARTMATRFRAGKRYEDALTGFTAKLTAEQLRTLRNDPNVVAIEQDQYVKQSVLAAAPADPKAARAGEEPTVKGSATQSKAPWGLDRIDERLLPLDGKYIYKRAGTGTNVYVIDSGVRTTHKQFGGRADTVANLTSDPTPHCPGDGHGTHVAATIAGSTYGVAKNARIHSVRVFACPDDEPEGAPMSRIVEAVNWVQAHHAKASIANLSLGGPKSAALNNAVAKLSGSGVFVVVAAGNGDENGRGLNACNGSPSGAAWVEAVGATTKSDYKTPWSDYGKCVDILAPGSYIPSAWNTSDTATKTISGTSMAAPHVAGVAALYKSYYPNANFSAVQKWLHNASTKNKIKNAGTGTPNRLLYKAGL